VDPVPVPARSDHAAAARPALIQAGHVPRRRVCWLTCRPRLGRRPIETDSAECRPDSLVGQAAVRRDVERCEPLSVRPGADERRVVGGDCHPVRKPEAIGDLSKRAVRREQGDPPGGWGIARSKVEADVVDVGVSTPIDDDLLPLRLGRRVEIGMAHERAVGSEPEQNAAGRPHEHQGPHWAGSRWRTAETSANRAWPQRRACPRDRRRRAPGRPNQTPTAGHRDPIVATRRTRGRSSTCAAPPRLRRTAGRRGRR
jgi:hypothetical protein